MYRFDLTEPVTAERVRSNETYIYSDFKFNIDYRRVLDLLMGERLYGNAVIALRELLQNSVDAIRYRKLLEEKSDVPFKPEITVHFESDQLTIEDNGIGIGEHIFKNYFIQVGRSYYRSAEFRAANIGLDPISEFGIGILSVFMVAERFEVESRRLPIDPLNPPEPIHVEIPTAYGYFVQRPSTRTKIGTSIKLFLKPDHPFSSDNLLKLISDIAPFIEYQIFIHTPNATSEYIPLTIGVPIAPFDLKRQFCISLEDSNDPRLTGVAGNLYIIANGQYGMRGEAIGVVAQRGFAISKFDIYDESETRSYSMRSSTLPNLFPDWTGIEPSVDLRGEAKLTLTPDRGDVIEDERFSNLRSAIEDRITEAFRTHLETYRRDNPLPKYEAYIDGLLDEGVLTAHMYIGFKLKRGIKNLFLDLVPLPCISSDGKFSRCYGREIEKTEIIAFTSEADWPRDISAGDVREAVQKGIYLNCPLLVHTEPGHFARSNFSTHIFGEETGLLITSIPGVILNLISNDPETIRDFHIDGKMHFTRGIRSLYNDNIPVFLHQAAPSYIQNPMYNVLHPLISPFFIKEEPKNQECKGLLLSLDSELDGVFEDLIVEPNFTIMSSKKNRIDRSDAPNAFFVGILSREPSLLDLICAAFTKLWARAQEVEAISPEVLFPGCTSEDLPWFWSHVS